MKITEREILPLLATAALVCQTGQTPEELATLANIFAEDLAEENLESVKRAFVLHRRRSARFPTPAHILAILPECRVVPKLEALPQISSGKKTPGAGRLAFMAFKGDGQAREALGVLAGNAARP